MSGVASINKLLNKIFMLGRADKNEEALVNLDKILEIDPGNIIAYYLKSVIYKKLGKFTEHSDYVEKARILSHIQRKEDIFSTLNQIDKCLETYSHELEGLYIRGLLISKLREICEEEEYFRLRKQYINILEEAIDFHDKLFEFEIGYKLIWNKMEFLVKIIDNNAEKAFKHCSDEHIILNRYGNQGWMFDYVALYLDFLLEHNIKDLCILNNKGITLLRNFRYLRKENEAVEYFNKAMEIDPEYISALNNLGVLTKSIEYFDRVLELDDLNFTANFNKSFTLFNKGTYEDMNPTKKSLQYCEKALKIYPHDKSCLFLLGSIHKALRNYELAFNSYDNALKYAPDNVYILESQASLLVEMDRYKEAFKYFDKTTELEPGNMNLWEEKVKINKKLKDVESEFNCYEKMLIQIPAYTFALVGKGRMLVDRGKYEEAVTILDDVEGGENWDNFWPLAIFHKARAAALQNNKNKAFQLIEESIRAGAAFNEFYSELEIKKLIKESPDFDQYKEIKEFESILAHDYNTKEESDKFWCKY